MAYNPGVSFFIPFHELDPSKDSQCIYFTQKGARCRWNCHRNDNEQAVVLHKAINAISSKAVSLDLLQEYVLCICCRAGRAQHRDRIEDVGLLILLAQRWQDEIRRHTNSKTPVPALKESIESLFYDELNAPQSSSINATPSKPVASSPYLEFCSSEFPYTTKFGFQSLASQPRYDLRTREAVISTSSTLTQPRFISQPPLSEFRPHIADPLPSDSVFQKILDRLIDRDFETGSLYIFDRASSPGHVKIGWTAVSVSRRLEDWSRCGYKPKLLFSVSRVPHAQRVETLTHHELIKEWRRERMCKASWCRKSHQEWFEISEERAEQVLGDWADFITRAKPYDSEGRLKSRWRVAVEMMDKNKNDLTAKRLLEYYEELLVQATTPVKEPVDLGHELKIDEKEEVGIGNRPKLERLETLEEAPVGLGSLWIKEPTSPKRTPPLKSVTLAERTPLTEISISKSNLLSGTRPLPRTEQLLTTNQVSTNQPLSFTEPQFSSKPRCKQLSPTKTVLFSPGPLPKADFTFAVEHSCKIEPLLKAGPLFNAKSLFDTKPLPKSEPIHKEVSASQATPVKKEISPEQIPLPPSPLLQPLLSFSRNILPSQETMPIPSPGTEETCAMDTTCITNSETNITVVDISNPKAKPVANALAPLSPEITEALLSLSLDELEELAETLDPITQRHQKNVERDGRAEPESEPFGCDRQTHQGEMRSYGQDKSTATTTTITTTPTEEDTGDRGEWEDTEVTLVEDWTLEPLEQAALKIVDELSDRDARQSCSTLRTSL